MGRGWGGSAGGEGGGIFLLRGFHAGGGGGRCFGNFGPPRFHFDRYREVRKFECHILCYVFLLLVLEYLYTPP